MAEKLNHLENELGSWFSSRAVATLPVLFLSGVTGNISMTLVWASIFISTTLAWRIDKIGESL